MKSRTNVKYYILEGEYLPFRCILFWRFRISIVLKTLSLSRKNCYFVSMLFVSILFTNWCHCSRLQAYVFYNILIVRFCIILVSFSQNIILKSDVFFSIWFFFHMTLTIPRTAGESGGAFWFPLYHFHSLHEDSHISRKITAENLWRQHIAIDRNGTWNLSFPSANY